MLPRDFEKVVRTFDVREVSFVFDMLYTTCEVSFVFCGSFSIHEQRSGITEQQQISTENHDRIGFAAWRFNTPNYARLNDANHRTMRDMMSHQSHLQSQSYQQHFNVPQQFQYNN